MKWEYKAARVKEDRWDVIEIPLLDRLGREGWELVSVDNGIAYFKRPHPESVADMYKHFTRAV